MIGAPVLQDARTSGFLTIDFREGVTAAEKLALLEAWKTFALVSASPCRSKTDAALFPDCAILITPHAVC